LNLRKIKVNTAGGCPAASYLLLLRQKKVTEEKATPVCRRCAVPCVAQQVRLPHKLARSATRPRAQTYSSEFPDPPALLGGAQGKESQKPNLKTSEAGYARLAHKYTSVRRAHTKPQLIFFPLCAAE
jgi:hypothetical protein